MSIEDVASLQRLAGADLATTLAAFGAEGVERKAITRYESLSDLEVVEAPGGARIMVRGDDLLLVYLGPDTVPAGVTHDALVAALGTEGVSLTSRQGKGAEQHVVAEQGIAWSEDDGEVGFVEVFPPTDAETYQREIYRERTFKR